MWEVGWEVELEAEREVGWVMEWEAEWDTEWEMEALSMIHILFGWRLLQNPQDTRDSLCP